MARRTRTTTTSDEIIGSPPRNPPRNQKSSADFLAGNAATRVKVIVFYRDVILNLERDKAPVSASINNEKLQRCAAAAAAAARGVERLADPPSLARKDIHLEAQPPEDELQKRFLFGCSILRFSGGTFSKNEKENA
jgi:hypothetical protein